MGRNTEAAVIGLFTTAVSTPIVAAVSWALIGPQASGNHVGIALILAFAATVAAFVAARLLLARSAIDSYAEGVKLGALSAVGFYFGWLLVFALIPALVGAPDGWAGFLGFFLRAAGHVIWISGGLPVIVGIAIGLSYIALKRRFMPATHS
jgi:hypothetical protein